MCYVEAKGITCDPDSNVIYGSNSTVTITQSNLHLLTYLPTYLLHSAVLLEQLTVLQLVNKFPALHGTPKVHYRTHKLPPPVSILDQPNPFRIPTSHLLEIHPNIIHPSTPRSHQWSLSLRFPSKTLYTPLSSPIRATCPAHLILLDFINPHNIGRGNNCKNL